MSDDDRGSDERDDDERDEPLGELAERTRRRHDDTEADELMDAFEAVETGELDEERLWAELEVDDPGVSGVPDEEPAGTTGEATGAGVDESAGRRERADDDRAVEEVSKHQYCGRCQYFSAPPEVRCTHEDGEIVEVVGTDRFAISGCPILRGEEELQQLGK